MMRNVAYFTHDFIPKIIHRSHNFLWMKLHSWKSMKIEELFRIWNPGYETSYEKCHIWPITFSNMKIIHYCCQFFMNEFSYIMK